MSTPQRVIQETSPVGRIVADPSRQYVVAGSGYAAEQLAKTLSNLLDDTDRTFTQETCEQMLSDSEIAKNMRVIKTTVLNERIELSPAVQEGHPRFTRAREITDFHLRSLEHLERASRQTFRDIAWMMLDMLSFGNKAAEITLSRPRESNVDRMKMYLDSLNVLPRKSVAYVQSNYNRTLGLLAPTRERPTMSMLSNPPAPLIIPRDKFWVMTNDPRDGDPRGQTILKPVFMLWRMKCESFPEWMRWLAFIALPLLIGVAAQGTTQIKRKNERGEEVLVNGQPQYLTQEEALAEVLGNAVISRAIVVPNGGDVKAIQIRGNGEPFTHSISFIDTAITTSMLLQALSTRGGEFSTRAQSVVHKAAEDTLVYFIKGAVCDGFRRDVLKLSTYVNFGEDDVELAPIASLGDTERRDWAKEGATLAQLVNAEYFTDEQYRDMDIQFGVPPRPMGWKRERKTTRGQRQEGDAGGESAAKQMTPEQVEAYAVKMLKASPREAKIFAGAFLAVQELLKGEGRDV